MSEPVYLNEKGMTLIELVIAVVITSILLFGVYVAMFRGNEQVQETGIKMTLQDQGREGLYKMVQEIRQSAPDRVTVGESGSEIEFEMPDPDDLVDESFDVNWDSAINVTYLIEGSQLVRQVDGVTTDVIANDVSQVTFEGDEANPNLVTITIGLQRSMLNGRLVPETPLEVAGQAEVRNS